jgi:hypothetical protein
VGVSNQIGHSSGGGWVEPGGWLVIEHDGWVIGERSRECESLSLPAAQSRGWDVCGDVEFLEPFCGRLATGAAMPGLASEIDVLFWAQLIEQREGLKYDASFARSGRFLTKKDVTADSNSVDMLGEEAGNDFQEDTFSDAAGTNDERNLRGRKFRIDFLEESLLSSGHAQLLEPNWNRGCFPGSHWRLLAGM